MNLTEKRLSEALRKAGIEFVLPDLPGKACVYCNLPGANFSAEEKAFHIECLLNLPSVMGRKGGLSTSPIKGKKARENGKKSKGPHKKIAVFHVAREPGDSPASIAETFMGSPREMCALIVMNPHIKHARIHRGDTLRLRYHCACGWEIPPVPDSGPGEVCPKCGRIWMAI
jgi:hypothetical protein